MADSTIENLPTKASMGRTDLIPIADVSDSNITKKVSFTNMLNNILDVSGNLLMTVDPDNKIVNVGPAYVPASDFDPNISFYVTSDINGYTGINVSNYNSGTLASADVIVLSMEDPNIASPNYADFGINGTNWADPDYATFDAGAGFVYANVANFYVGSGGTGANGNLYFFTGGHDNKNLIRLTINSSGNAEFTGNVLVDGTLTATSPVINTGFSGTAGAAGSDVTTGTSTTKIVTPKAIADAGIIATTVTATSTSTLTNKAITKRLITTTDDATSVIDCTITDVYQLSAVANATEFTITGTPVDGQRILIRYKDAGVAKNLTWTGITALGITLPTITTAGKWEYVGIEYNTAASQWFAIAQGKQA